MSSFAAEIVTLTVRARAVVDGEDGARARFDSSHVLAPPENMSFVLTDGKALNLDGWLAWLRKFKCVRLELEAQRDGFESESGLFMAALRGDQWHLYAGGPGETIAFRPRWRANMSLARGWLLTLTGRRANVTPRGLSPELEPSRSLLRKATVQAADFARQTGQRGFAEQFERALASLDDENARPQAWYAAALPANAGTIERQTMAAVESSWVHGGMGGGWEDSIYPPQTEVLFCNTVHSLYEAHSACIEAIVNRTPLGPPKVGLP